MLYSMLCLLFSPLSVLSVQINWLWRFVLYLPGNAVDVKLDHVLSTGVILWLPSSVLRVDDAAARKNTRVT